jgi:predicted ATPase
MTSFLGICLTVLGYFDSAAAKTRAAIHYAKTLNHPVSVNLGLRRACLQGMLLRDTRRVVEFSSELAALRAAYETYQGTWEGTFFQDWAQLRMQSDPVRLDRVRTFLEHLDRSNIWALLPFYMASAAELIGQYGDGATAAALVERADELVNMPGGRWCEAEVMRLRARFCSRNPEEAAALLNASLARAKEQNAKLWELRTAADLAALLRDQGNFGCACEVLRPVCEWFNEGKNVADYIAARALLDDIEGRHAARSKPNASS